METGLGGQLCYLLSSSEAKAVTIGLKAFGYSMLAWWAPFYDVITCVDCPLFLEGDASMIYNAFVDS
jgi:hypothetical protein